MVPKNRPLSAGILGAVSASLLAVPTIAGALTIDAAVWKPDQNAMVVVGTRTAGEEVTVVNAYDPTLVIRKDAKLERGTEWRVTQISPSPVPCRVLAISSNGEQTEQDLKFAPADCAPKPPTRILTIDAATWKADTNALVVVGTRTAGVEVTVANAYDPTLVIKKDARLDRGTVWKTTTFGTSPVPCRVRATSGDGQQAEREVKFAPSDCAPKDSNEPPVADAGPDQTLTLAVGQPSIEVRLDGNASTDPDGRVAAWSWTGTPDPADVPQPAVTLAAGQYSFGLTVTDEDGEASATDNVVITVNPAVVSGDPHESIAVYVGPASCITCHEAEANEMHGSVHYQQAGPTDYVTNIPGPAGERWNGLPGEGFTGINTYCGTHQNSPRFTCAGCHVGNGRFPKTPETLAGLSHADQLTELSNIDCLTCHQEQYKRFPDPTGEFLALTIVSPDPVTGEPSPLLDPIVRTGLEGIPAVHPVTQDFQFVPADPTNPLLAGAPIPLMEISGLDAARTVHATTRKSCLNCHAGAAGSDGAKRGDLSSLLADPPLGLDMHMSSAGGGLDCADCHSEGGHRVAGRGVDLRANDVPGRLTCENSGCHSTHPHGDYSARTGTARDTHAGHIACQTCHIPTFGKGVPTEMMRDWEDPHFSEQACNGRGGWLPREVKTRDQVPSYAWFNGKSEVYYLTEPLTDVPTMVLANTEADGLGLPRGSRAYMLGMPLGGVSDASAKLHPMKEHLGKLARHTATDTLIGHSTYDFFRTGNFDAAVRSGMEQTEGMSATDGYEVVAVHTYQSINHGVEVAGNALQCGSCHSSFTTGKPLRMDLKGQLGYELKGTNAQVCTQCHSDKGSMNFTKVHDKHVREKGRDCSTCHKFSRPERGLSTRIGG